MSETTNQNTTTNTQKKNAKTNEFVNEVAIQGRLIHKYSTEKTTILTVNVGRPGTTPDYPKIVFFGPAKEDAAKYETGSFVKITGNIQSSKKNPNIKNQVLVSIFGESISPAETQFEKDFDVPGIYAPIVNHFRLAGNIVSVDIPSKNVARFTVRCHTNGHLSLIPIVYFSKDPAKVVAEHLPGTFVRAYGSVQTSKTVKNGASRYYQSYIATELQ